jgi:hypothetical protein
LGLRGGHPQQGYHLRELRYFDEATGYPGPIGLREVLVEGKKAVQATQAEGQTALDAARI